jgi:hypothetical protein
MCEFSEKSDTSTLGMLLAFHLNINGQIVLTYFTCNSPFGCADNGTASFSVDQETGNTESPVNRLMHISLFKACVSQN